MKLEDRIANIVRRHTMSKDERIKHGLPTQTVKERRSALVEDIMKEFRWELSEASRRHPHLFEDNG